MAPSTIRHARTSSSLSDTRTYNASGYCATPMSVCDGTAGERTCEWAIAQKTWSASSVSMAVSYTHLTLPTIYSV